MNFVKEDIEIVSGAKVPRLSVEYPSLPARKTKEIDILKSCLQLKFESVVVRGQEAGDLPKPEDLVKLPAFVEARRNDARFLEEERRQERHRAQEAERERIEKERAEAEKRRARELIKQEQRKKRLEEKEKRRQERLEAKREALIIAKEEKKKRYEEQYEKWNETVKERKHALEVLQEKLVVAQEKKKALEDEIKSIDEDKQRYLQKLRDLALKPEAEVDKAKEQKDQREDRTDVKNVKRSFSLSDRKERKEGQSNAGSLGVGKPQTDGGGMRGSVQTGSVGSLEKKFTIRRHDDDLRKSRTYTPSISTVRSDRERDPPAFTVRSDRERDPPISTVTSDRERDRSADRMRPQFSIRRGLPRSNPGDRFNRPRPSLPDRRDDRERYYDRNRDEGRDRFGDREGSRRLHQDRRPMYTFRDGYQRGRPSERFRRESSPR
eukprot:jgi/Picsp_1/3520/NSC_06358-R1_---NA---